MVDRKVPVCLIVDDPPINASYWIRRQSEEFGIATEPKSEFGRFVADWRAQEPSAIVPNSFWAQFIRWARDEGVRGKFTFLPCPAGLGCIDDKVEGYAPDELSELIGIIREEYQQQFDITPEMFTHSMAWDIEARRNLPVTEFDWMSGQSEDTLAGYMAEALRILKEVGIEPTGVTQPCNFRADEQVYARAVLRAVKEACGLTHTYYFLHADGESLPAPSPVMIADPERDEFVVSIVSAVRADEPFWDSLYGAGDVDDMAGYFISSDGRSGRLVDLLQAGGPVIFHCHSQTIHSNGTEKGFQALQLVVDRINRHLAGRVEWMGMQDFAEQRISRVRSG